MDESPGKMYALASVMTMLAVVPVLLRFRVRSNQNLSLGPDDWLMIPALIGTLGSAIAMYIATAEGGLGLHTPIGPDGAPDFTDATVIFLKASFVTLLTQIVTFSCTKLSVIFFYRRIFVGIVFNIASWTLITIVLLWSVGYFFANLFECKPIEANWVANGVSSTCVDELTMYISESWTDVFTDVLILSLPLPMIWKLHMTTARKLALCGVFLLGALTVVASIARLAVYYHIENVADTEGAADITWLVAPTFYWPMIESSLGILGACLPALRPIFRGFSPESVIRSIRSALSLDSLGSRHSKTGSERSKQPAKAIDQNGSEVELTGVHSLGSAHGESHRNETGLAKTADSDVERPHGGSVPADGIMVERSYNVV